VVCSAKPRGRLDAVLPDGIADLGLAALSMTEPSFVDALCHYSAKKYESVPVLAIADLLFGRYNAVAELITSNGQAPRQATAVIHLGRYHLAQAYGTLRRSDPSRHFRQGSF
jgi:hypothetical protein